MKSVNAYNKSTKSLTKAANCVQNHNCVTVVVAVSVVKEDITTTVTCIYATINFMVFRNETFRNISCKLCDENCSLEMHSINNVRYAPI